MVGLGTRPLPWIPDRARSRSLVRDDSLRRERTPAPRVAVPPLAWPGDGGLRSGKRRPACPARLDTGNPGSLKRDVRSEEHTSELQSLMRTSYAVFCLKKKTK